MAKIELKLKSDVCSYKTVTDYINTWKNHKFLLHTFILTNPKWNKMGVLQSNREASTDNSHHCTLCLNYTGRKVALINSLMYEANIQIFEYEGTLSP